MERLHQRHCEERLGNASWWQLWTSSRQSGLLQSPYVYVRQSRREAPRPVLSVLSSGRLSNLSHTSTRISKNTHFLCLSSRTIHLVSWNNSFMSERVSRWKPSRSDGSWITVHTGRKLDRLVEKTTCPQPGTLPHLSQRTTVPLCHPFSRRPSKSMRKKKVGTIV